MWGRKPGEEITSFSHGSPDADLAMSAVFFNEGKGHHKLG